MPLPLLHRAAARRGISLLEALLALAILSIVAGFALFQTVNLRESSQHVRLTDATAVLNSAVAAYLKNGGMLPSGCTGDTVLAKLKTRVDSQNEPYFVGFKGPFIDVRIKGIAADLHKTSPRIAWDDGLKRFRMRTSGPGWSNILFDRQEAKADHGTESRTAFNSFARESLWVWDYSDASARRRGVRNLPTASPATPQPVLPDDPVPLLPPVINPKTGVYDHRNYPLSLTITDLNPPGASDILYQVNGGEWRIWPGGQSPVPKSLTNSVNAFARSREAGFRSDSGITGETYTTYFLKGAPSGEFADPRGDRLMVHALASDGLKFHWGKTESAGHSKSELELIAADAFEAGPEETFPLGTIVYRNGVTRAGTNARSVTFRMDLVFAVPASGLLSFQFPVRILNSIHYPWIPPAERQDFIWLPQELVLSPALTVLDRNFTVRLQLSAPNAVIEGDDLKIPVSEDASAEISLQASIELTE